MPDKYVTRTGRSLGPGKVTRASHLVRTRQRKQEKPLPPELMCHPKRLHPTTRNPSCSTQHSWNGVGITMANTWSRDDFLRGRHLNPVGRYDITAGTVFFGACDDVRFAMAWKFAAKRHGITVEVTDNGIEAHNERRS